MPTPPDFQDQADLWHQDGAGFCHPAVVDLFTDFEIFEITKLPPWVIGAFPDGWMDQYLIWKSSRITHEERRAADRAKAKKQPYYQVPH